jgi:hypothetical protein
MMRTFLAVELQVPRTGSGASPLAGKPRWQRHGAPGSRRAASGARNLKPGAVPHQIQLGLGVAAPSRPGSRRGGGRLATVTSRPRPSLNLPRRSSGVTLHAPQALVAITPLSRRLAGSVASGSPVLPVGRPSPQPEAAAPSRPAPPNVQVIASGSSGCGCQDAPPTRTRHGTCLLLEAAGAWISTPVLPLNGLRLLSNTGSLSSVQIAHHSGFAVKGV